MLMICEDAQWADPATLETLSQLVKQIRQSAVLLVVTCRPEFMPSWSDHDVTLLHLTRLSRSDGKAIANQLVGSMPLPDELLTQIIERTDGVPLFVEELTQSVLESGFVRDAGDHWELTRPLQPLAIPSTIQDSLMARLDHLGKAKEVAQIGACIGREFDHELLSAIVPIGDAGLRDALARLVDSGLVFRHGSDRETVYTFKHALVSEVAYDSLLISRRKQIHAAIAHAFSGEIRDRARTRPELLALHLTRADLIDLAVPQWRTAARSAMAKNRHREALGYVDAGLALIDQAAMKDRAQHEVRLLLQGAACHWVLTGYACKQAAALWARVEELIDQVTDPRLLVMGLSGILACAYVGGDIQKALAVAERLVALGESAEDIDSTVVAYACVGPILHQQGRFEQCTKLLEFVLDLYKPDRRGGFGPTYDPRVAACNWLGYCHLAAGRFDQAKQHARMAVDHATAIAQPFVLSMALSIAARTFSETGDQETALDLCNRCIELCDAQNLPFWKGWAIASEGVALERCGKHQQAERRLAEGIEHLSARGSRVDSGYMYAWRAQALAHLGRFDDARSDIEMGRLECARSGHLLSLIDLAYSRGVIELLLSESDITIGEHWLNVALTDSRAVGSRLMELRAATSLASLWKARGQRREAQDLLGPVVSTITEGLDCGDMTIAIALLKSLDVANS